MYQTKGSIYLFFQLSNPYFAPASVLYILLCRCTCSSWVRAHWERQGATVQVDFRQSDAFGQTENVIKEREGGMSRLWCILQNTKSGLLGKLNMILTRLSYTYRDSAVLAACQVWKGEGGEERYQDSIRNISAQWGRRGEKRRAISPIVLIQTSLLLLLLLLLVLLLSPCPLAITIARR